MSAFVKKNIAAKKEQERAGKVNPLKISARSLFLLKEFGKGEHLALPDSCILEFPDATKDGDITSEKYKRFIVHYRPESGMYAGGTFRLMFDVSNVPEYPYKPPKVRCLTKVWHPNIADDGRVCHNYLQTDAAFQDGAGWSPAIHMQELVNAILTMFDERSDSFNPDEPLNDVAAAHFKRDKESFASKASQWTREFARPIPVEEWRLASSN